MECPSCGSTRPDNANFCPTCGRSVRAQERSAARRVVVTGVGAVSPLALNADETWSKLVAGESGVRRIDRFDASSLPVQIAADVRDFSVRDWVDSKTERQMAMFAQFGVAAAGMALNDAGVDLDSVDPARAAVAVGTGAGGMATILDAHDLSQRRGLMRLSPFFMTTFPHNLAAYHISQLFRFLGPSLTVSTACATGAQAIGVAAQNIQRGEADIAITGGSEYSVFPLFLASFAVQRAVSTMNDQPEKASRPFDATREGFVLGEGAAMLVLESLEHAQARGATIYAEFLGYGSSNDGYHPIAPNPDGVGAAQAIVAALDDGGIEPEQVDYVNAHAASTPLGDKAETLAIKKALGNQATQIPVNSTKSMIGHLMGAAGAIEAMATVLSIRDQVVHPTINYQNPDPECDLDFVPNEARPASINVAITNSFGLGGQNACLAFGRYRNGATARS